VHRFLALAAALALPALPAFANSLEEASTPDPDLPPVDDEIAEGQATDFRGRIKRIRIRERASGSNYNLTVVLDDDGAGDVASTESVRITLGNDGGTAAPVAVGSPELTTRVRSEAIDFGFATAPVGYYQLLASPVDADGQSLAPSQVLQLDIDGVEGVLTIGEGSPDGVAITDGSFSVNDCGNGRLKLQVTGTGAGAVAGVAFQWIEPFEGPVPTVVNDVAPTVARTARFSTKTAQFGEFRATFAGADEVALQLQVEALNEDGGVLGTFPTDTSARNGSLRTGEVLTGPPIVFNGTAYLE
jgi:hypothetical protein